MECVRGIAPGASQIATRQTHEYARQARARAFALNRFENFRDNHFECGSLPRLLPGLAAAFSAAPQPDLRDLRPAGFRLAPASARQPANHSEKKCHRHDQPRIARRYSHGSQHYNVARCHEQRGDHDNEERPIHRLTRFQIN